MCLTSPLLHYCGTPSLYYLLQSVYFCLDVLHLLLRRFFLSRKSAKHANKKKRNCATASYMTAQWLWGAQATCTWGSLTVEVAVISGSHGEGRFSLTPRYTISLIHTLGIGPSTDCTYKIQLQAGDDGARTSHAHRAVASATARFLYKLIIPPSLLRVG